MARQALSQRIALGIQGIALGVAKLAGYNAAQSSKTQAPATRIGTNPNSSFAQLQRVRLSFEGENAIKNTSFARNYVLKRRMYCSSGITYAPDTGDHALDEAVSAYCIQQWKTMGIGCSMQQAFSRVADVFLPERGDSALQWYRDEDSLRLLEITADRIGELYQFTRPTKDLQTGETYFSGLFLRGPNTTGYKIYERGFDMVYTNPQRVNACDVLFFKDDITGGVRGVSIFAAALEDINSRYQILKSTKDTMQQQSKIAAIASNNSGAPSELDYETVTHPDGAIEYQETFADGAVVKYQFNGDSYQVLKGEHPSEAFIGGMKYLDASAALAVGMPYEFLFSGAESGGAPFRGAFEAAGKEIMRIRRDVHTPKLETIAYVTIMDGVERGKLPPKANIARGSWNFGTLPTADSFRDDAADIKAIRAGITTKSAVITANSGRSFPVVLRESMQEAVATAMAVEDANRALVKAGYKPSVTVADIAQVSDNPQQAAAAENIQQGKPSEGPAKPQGEAPAKATAAMAAAHDVSDEKRADDGKWTSGAGSSDKVKAASAATEKANQSKSSEDHSAAAKAHRAAYRAIQDEEGIDSDPWQHRELAKDHARIAKKLKEKEQPKPAEKPIESKPSRSEWFHEQGKTKTEYSDKVDFTNNGRLGSVVVFSKDEYEKDPSSFTFASQAAGLHAKEINQPFVVFPKSDGEKTEYRIIPAKEYSQEDAESVVALITPDGVVRNVTAKAK